MIKRIALSFSNRIPSTVRAEDLISVATLAVTQNMPRIDRSFSEYEIASWITIRAKGAIRDYLRDLDFATRDGRRAKNRIEAAAHKLNSGGLEISDESLAAESGLSIDLVRRVRRSVQPLMDLDARVRMRNDAEVVLGSTIPDTDSFSRVFDATAESQTTELLDRALEMIRPRYRRILENYFWGQMTMKEISALEGVNESRISQIVKNSMPMLKQAFRKLGVTSFRHLAA